MDTKERTVLIAMDGSLHSEYAFEYYVNYIHRWNDNVIIVFSVEKPKKIHRIRTKSISGSTEESYSSIEFRPRASSVRSSDSTFEEVSDYVKQVFRQIEEVANKHRIRHLLERLGEPPGDAIIKAAELHKANLIITGSRGMGKLRRTILGSVSEYIVHHSQIPVLVCKSDPEVKKLKD